MMQIKKILCTSCFLLASTSVVFAQFTQAPEATPSPDVMTLQTQDVPSALPAPAPSVDVVPPKGTIEYFKRKVREFKEMEIMQDSQDQTVESMSRLIDELRERNQHLEMENEALKASLNECSMSSTSSDGEPLS